MSTPTPTQIGKYDVIGVIGRGGMGVVYQGRDSQLDRPVAIKMIVGVFAEHPDMLKRFFREAQSLGSLQHRNIVTVFDLGDYDGNPYLVMEYLEGEGLDQVLANRRQLNLLEKLAIVIQVCRGLNYAHRRGVVHRDIKPANIMLGQDGGVKIFDFGIARAGDENVTRTGQVMGTLKYMAPEQFNSKSPDHRTDIFSTGVVLYQLLTNHMPFEADNTASTMLKIVNEPPPPLSNFLSSFPPELEQILHRALEKNPADRYSSADEFAQDLEQLQGQLKEELIRQELQEVTLFLDRGEILKAQGVLVRVLRVDQQHNTANRLLREVQQRIQREEIGKQVYELRERAEDAMAHEQFENALEHADRALGLDRNNTELQQLREAIRAAARRAEKLHNALKSAEAARAEGKLDEAREAAEAALAVAPNDTLARTLHRLISRDIETRSRQIQMEGYLQEARQDISSRKFTSALEILKRADELDASVPQVQSLIELAVAGQEQERRRRELEALTNEVQDALNSDDYRTACRKADEGLAQFPEDRNLVKLKALAERQRQIDERRQFVDELLVEARKLIQAGRNLELQETVEKAISQIGPEPRLQSLLSVVRENIQRDRMKQQKIEGLQRARQSLDNQAFDDAIQILEGLANELGDDVECRELLIRAQSERADAVQAAVHRAEQEPGLDKRVHILEEALGKYPQETLLEEHLSAAREQRSRVTSLVADARNLEQSRRYDSALVKWEALATVDNDYPDLANILEQARERHRQARLQAKANYVKTLQLILSSAEYDRAEDVLAQAKRDFSGDRELAEIERRILDGIVGRAQAEKSLASAARAVEKKKWTKALESFQEATATAKFDPLIRQQLVSGLVSAADAALQSDREFSEMLAAEAAQVDPDSPLLDPVRSKIDERRRGEATEECLTVVQSCLSAGDLQGALRSLDRGLSASPNEPRLLESNARVEGEIRRREEESRARELQEKEAREKALREEEQRRAREQEGHLQDLRDKEAREKDLRGQEQREKEMREQRSAPPRSAGALDVSATEIFAQGATPAAGEISARSASPVAPSAKQDPQPAARTSSFESGSAPIQQGVGSDELRETSLQIIERQLAAFIGPVARVMVKRAAGKTTSVFELYTILAANLEREDDRAAFLARRAERTQGKVPIASSTSIPAQPRPLAATTDVSPPGEITPSDFEKAVRRLATYLGPIAAVLAKKESRRATSLRNLYELLAEHVADAADRERFLKDAGIQ
jgi:serine/threonine protein kinase